MAAGTLSGVATAGLFNPYDRALYLSVVKERVFLDKRNWRNPFHGASNALLHRTISGGLYFAMYDMLQSPVRRALGGRNHNSNSSGEGSSGSNDNELLISFVTGAGAGCVNGIILNPIAAVKYAAWGSDTSKGLKRFAVSLWNKGGARPFVNGVVPTIYRDMVFGGAYAYLRFALARWIGAGLQSTNTSNNHTGRRTEYLVGPASQFAGAAIATTASSPFNYWRNLQFATNPGDTPVGMRQCMSELSSSIREARGAREKLAQISLKLRVGWGTVRVATGMAVGQQLYDYISRKLASYY